MLCIAAKGVTYKYDETSKAGIENVWCGHLKLDMKRQSAVCRHRPEGRRDGQGENAWPEVVSGLDDAGMIALVVYVVCEWWSP
jgi:hypothetical protein